MDILRHYETLRATLIAEKEQKIAVIKEQIKRDIQPKFAELDKLKQEALNKASVEYNNNRNLATEQYNAQLVALKEKFEVEQKAILQTLENKKTEMLNLAIQEATYEEEKQCARAVADIDGLINKIKVKE